MSQAGLKIFLIFCLAIIAGLSLVDAKYSTIFVKGFFSLVNLIFAIFVFRSLVDMNNNYKSAFFPILLIISLLSLAIPILIILSLFL